MHAVENVITYVSIVIMRAKTGENISNDYIFCPANEYLMKHSQFNFLYYFISKAKSSQPEFVIYVSMQLKKDNLPMY